MRYVAKSENLANTVARCVADQIPFVVEEDDVVLTEPTAEKIDGLIMQGVTVTKADGSICKLSTEQQDAEKEATAADQG